MLCAHCPLNHSCPMDLTCPSGKWVVGGPKVLPGPCCGRGREDECSVATVAPGKDQRPMQTPFLS